MTPSYSSQSSGHSRPASSTASWTASWTGCAESWPGQPGTKLPMRASKSMTPTHPSPSTSHVPPSQVVGAPTSYSPNNARRSSTVSSPSVKRVSAHIPFFKEIALVGVLHCRHPRAARPTRSGDVEHLESQIGAVVQRGIALVIGKTVYESGEWILRVRRQRIDRLQNVTRGNVDLEDDCWINVVRSAPKGGCSA